MLLLPGIGRALCVVDMVGGVIQVVLLLRNVRPRAHSLMEATVPLVRSCSPPYTLELSYHKFVTAASGHHRSLCPNFTVLQRRRPCQNRLIDARPKQGASRNPSQMCGSLLASARYHGFTVPETRVCVQRTDERLSLPPATYLSKPLSQDMTPRMMDESLQDTNDRSSNSTKTNLPTFVLPQSYHFLAPNALKTTTKKIVCRASCSRSIGGCSRRRRRRKSERGSAAGCREAGGCGAGRVSCRGGKARP